jgi:predicted RNase H-like HicB family nuclease
MRYGYENIKNIKCGKLSLAEKNKTVNGIYLDITDKFENIANFTFTTNEAEQLANELLQLVFDATEKQILKNKKDITEEEWKVIDEQNWAKIKSKTLLCQKYLYTHDFVKTLSVIDIHDGNILSLESNTYAHVSPSFLFDVCRAIAYADGIGIDDDGEEIEIGNSIGWVKIFFKNTRQDEFEYSL